MYPNTLTSTKVRKNSKTSEYSTRYVCEGRDVDKSSVFEKSLVPNVYRYVYREEDFYYPELSKLDIKHLTSALGNELPPLKDKSFEVGGFLETGHAYAYLIYPELTPVSHRFLYNCYYSPINLRPSFFMLIAAL